MPSIERRIETRSDKTIGPGAPASAGRHSHDQERIPRGCHLVERLGRGRGSVRHAGGKVPSGTDRNVRPGRRRPRRHADGLHDPDDPSARAEQAELARRDSGREGCRGDGGAAPAHGCASVGQDRRDPLALLPEGRSPRPRVREASRPPARPPVARGHSRRTRLSKSGPDRPISYVTPPGRASRADPLRERNPHPMTGLSVFSSNPAGLQPFSDNFGEGDDFKMVDHVGKTVVVTVKGPEEVETKLYGRKTAIKADIITVEADGPKKYSD